MQQYVDPLPAPEGNRVPGVTEGRPRRQGELPASVRRSLRQLGEEGAALDRLATDPAFGAPSGRAPERRASARRRPAVGRDGSGGTARSAAAESLGSDALGLPLVLVLAGILGAGLTAFVLRRRGA